jgi:predicted 3-demethylubiquinone-9 3-methyltransferase (glyoxalase superfamily)
MARPSIQKIVPHLWYVREAEEAARFYASVFPDSRVDRVTALPVSFLVNCDSQAELDRYWSALLASGGKPQACGWIIDKYGLRWQIVPAVLGEMLADKDEAKAKRAAEEMLRQVKLDIAKLEAAFNGR